jgi:ankyrin repeat protein
MLMSAQSNALDVLAALAGDNPISLQSAIVADPSLKNYADANGRTLVHLAVHQGADTVLLWLLDQGYPANVADNHGETPLMRAAFLGDTDAIASLLTAGARVGTVAGSGGTALHYAYAGGKQGQAAIAPLLAAGADPGVRDSNGQAPDAWIRQAEIREAGTDLLAKQEQAAAVEARRQRLKIG